jgi:hypothetical protein
MIVTVIFFILTERKIKAQRLHNTQEHTDKEWHGASTVKIKIFMLETETKNNSYRLSTPSMVIPQNVLRMSILLTSGGDSMFVFIKE